ncbi:MULTISPECIES: hypothetical protein [unclassified Sinorhizobium]|uniref:hypothetical protein n=1 Tax=unclassified Sinorhizobium TaxID=2613772 RepID=UPI0035250E2E
MLVYGDVEHVGFPASARAEIGEKIDGWARSPPGRRRHELLVQAFLTTGELVQGLADQEFEIKAADDVSEIQQAGATLLLFQARAIMQSWRSGFSGGPSLPAPWGGLLERLHSPEPVRMRRAEGYALYALYPESYLEAASRSTLTPKTVVIGIRSIGITLAALVSAALGSGPAYSLRPTGHPFERHVQVSAALSKRILADTEADFAIVDEGPGLSGSSFGSVADWLQENGVAASRLHFFPSHRGDLGPHASASHRTRWAERPRHVVDVVDLILKSPEPAHRLQTWVDDLVGASGHSWRDVSGGGWRAVRYKDLESWPPSHMQMEKRKFLVQADGETWLVKFAGLGRTGMEKARRGSLLSEAGFTPKIAGTCYGFSIEKWLEGMPANAAGLPSQQVVDHLGQYLGFRARHLPAPNGGASVQDLCRMAIHNVGEALGADAAERLGRLIGRPKNISRRLRRIDTDNRLQTWEWLITGDGRLVKTDARDHNAAHDLVGCQDVAWDVAGACVEFDLSTPERDRLAEIVAREADCDLRKDVLTVFEACYLGFQIGLWSGARATVTGSEKERIGRLVKRYLDHLHQLLDA